MKIIIVLSVLLLGLVKPATAQLQAGMYLNPVTVDDRPVDYNAFSINTRGALALVEGDLRSANHKKAPFRVLLRRNGKIVRQWSAGNAKEHYALQLQNLMPNPNPYGLFLPLGEC